MWISYKKMILDGFSENKMLRHCMETTSLFLQFDQDSMASKFWFHSRLGFTRFTLTDTVRRKSLLAAFELVANLLLRGARFFFLKISTGTVHWG